MPKLEIGKAFDAFIEWLKNAGEPVFDGMAWLIESLLSGLETLLMFPPAPLLFVIFALGAYKISGKGMALFTLFGLFLIQNLGYWEESVLTLALVLTAVLFALVIGIPFGILSAKSDRTWTVVRPVLDFMQTLPAFVYLLPAVYFFSIGAVSGVLATLIFALPPCVRMTNLGIRQVPSDIREAAVSFGSNPKQLLFKAELPVAMPTIMAGINQTIMLALSMVVISGLIGAKGLGSVVVKGITQLDLVVGFEAGLCIVILAIILDRVTQELGKSSESSHG